MSGHSKWSQIKRQKGSCDLRRGQIFTKLANAISIAVRQEKGNTNPETNFHLRLLIDKAKQANMPKDNISRAIERGKKNGGEENLLEEVLYEGYSKNGIAIIVQSTTDNRSRITQEIKNIFDKTGGNLSTPGSVSFLFKKIGLIRVKSKLLSADEIMLIAIDIGALDVETDEKSVFIYTKSQSLGNIKKTLEEKGIEIEESEETMEPISPIIINNKKDMEIILSLIDRFKNHEDVQKVYTNIIIPDDLMKS